MAFQRDVHSKDPKRPPPKPASPGPIVVRVVSPFFSGMKKLFSKELGRLLRHRRPSNKPVSLHLIDGEAQGGRPLRRSRQGAAKFDYSRTARRYSAGCRNPRAGRRREFGRIGAGLDRDPDEEAGFAKQKHTTRDSFNSTCGATYYLADVLFGPLLGDKARPETDKKFWENREAGVDEESNQPTVDLSEMLGAQEEEANVTKKISADNVDTLTYEISGLRQRVAGRGPRRIRACCFGRGFVWLMPTTIRLHENS